MSATISWYIITFCFGWFFGAMNERDFQRETLKKDQQIEQKAEENQETAQLDNNDPNTLPEKP